MNLNEVADRRIKRPQRLIYLTLLVLQCLCSAVNAQQLKFVTINAWTGLDYVGRIKVGEYEPEGTRQQRFRILVGELKRIQPDILALQEVNPVSARGVALADELGYDCIYQRANSGAKIGYLGIPCNLNEGLVILAKRNLHLQFVDVWNLSDGFGIIGNSASLHWTERRIALVGKVRIGNQEVYVANIHLSSVVPEDTSARYVARQIASMKSHDEEKIQDIVNGCFSDAGNRMRSVEILLENIDRQHSGRAFIVLGDFNAGPSQPEIRRFTEAGRFLDVVESSDIGLVVTWDPERNTNVRYSVQPIDAKGDTLDTYGLLTAWYDAKPRRIDYIFLNDQWRVSDVADVRVVLDQPANGLFASDHYGLLATVNLSRVASQKNDTDDGIIAAPERKFEALPILSYDTDVGMGYGAKAFFLDFLGGSESFDLVAFNSTKGERWYRLVFSVPDFELRQGKVFPVSFDLIADYDKYLKNNFYGVGSGSRADERETYTKEPFEILGVASSGLSKEFVAQIGLKYRTVRNFGYETGKPFAEDLPAINHGRSSAWTLYGAARYDSRDSYINASRGQVAQLEIESGGSWLAGDYSITSTTFALQTYHVLFYPKTVFAARLRGHVVGGTDLPIHALASVGGNRTLRGCPQDRFLDKAAGVLNLELRFPLYWRFGGVLGLDVGKVFSSASAVSLYDWAVNPLVGLRFYMDTFLVRADVGFGKETTGFYLNFGQLF